MGKRWLRRSLLYIPGSSPKMLGKAAGIECDAVILDLEDSVGIAEKDAAREAVRELLPALTAQPKEAIVRVNAMDTVWGVKDLFAVVPERPSAVILPKADEKSLVTADMLLSSLEREHGVAAGSIGIIPLLETTYAIANAYQVLGACGRIVGAQLGAEDLTKEQEISRTPEGREIEYARQHLAMAARARGLDILDTPYTVIKDLEGLRRDALVAKSFGFTGKTCIHPSHVRIVDEVFSPTREEVAFAQGLLEVYTRALEDGRGACMYEGKMIDAPVAQRAERIVEKAACIGSYTQSELVSVSIKA